MSGPYIGDCVIVSGLSVYYSYDPNETLERREIEQILAASRECKKVWGPGRLAHISDVSARPVMFAPSVFAWVKESGRVPWVMKVVVKVGRARAEFNVECSLSERVIRENDDRAMFRALASAVEGECEKRYGPGKVVFGKGKTVTYLPEK